MRENRTVAWLRFAAFVILGAVTAFGVHSFMTGDWAEAVAYWRNRLEVLPLLAALAVADVVLEGLAWMWVYHRFRIRVFDAGGCCAFLAGRAGLLLPAQLGRLIRPEAMLRLRRAGAADAVKAETAVFVLDGISVIALLVALIGYRALPVVMPVAVIAAIGIMLFLGNAIGRLVSRTDFRFPVGFWWAWPTIFIILIDMGGWIAHGLALHVLVAGLPGDMTLFDSLLLGPGSAVLGVATGLPGGIGVTEAILGASLGAKSIPSEHLAVAVAAFRLITFWLWIPIGWIALGALRRRAPSTGSGTAAVPSRGETIE